MKHAELIEQLEEMRAQVRAEAESKMSALTDAIEVIKGGTPSAAESAAPAQRGEGRKEPSVPKMITKAFEELHAAGAEIVSSHAALIAKAKELFPDQSEKIERNIYVTISSMLKAGTLVRAPGGWKLES